MSDTSETLDATLSALSHPIRRGIIDSLLRGSATVKELAQPYNTTPGAISQHLKVLESAGLLKRNVKGRVHHCELDRAGMEPILNWVKQHEQFWQSQLDSLEAFVKSQKGENEDIDHA